MLYVKSRFLLFARGIQLDNGVHPLDKQAKEMLGIEKWSEDKVRWSPTCVKRQMEERIRLPFINSADCYTKL